ncbi:ABC transporter permease [Kaistia nematophila]|uniref:ABC transporter permease n=1 Tax=Kaistia nematophila TaxID=2994654 RepID=A0A9X3ILA7_9HYPH|nr:ABC transporter permease [Kaistia nematophila]MCX5569657.1 ABC transporter permease [Kaistia nematophila]
MSSIGVTEPRDGDLADRPSRGPAAVRAAGDLASRLARAALRQPGLSLAVIVLAVIALAALFPELLTSYNPIRGQGGARLKPPSAEHRFGTDQMGRDLFTRVVYGTRQSLKAVVLAVGIGMLVGCGIGLAAGYVGRWVDDILMRLMDVLLSVPMLLISLAIINALGFGMVNIAIAVGIGSVAGFARVTRAQVLKIRSGAFVEATLFAGISRLTVLRRHIIPNALGPVVVLATLELGWAILSVSALSFLGFGPPPPTPEWGLLVAGGRDYMTAAWWLTTMPGLVILATVLAANRVAQSLSGREMSAS